MQREADIHGDAGAVLFQQGPTARPTESPSGASSPCWGPSPQLATAGCKPCARGAATRPHIAAALTASPARPRGRLGNRLATKGGIHVLPSLPRRNRRHPRSGADRFVEARRLTPSPALTRALAAPSHLARAFPTRCGAGSTLSRRYPSSLRPARAELLSDPGLRTSGPFQPTPLIDLQSKHPNAPANAVAKDPPFRCFDRSLLL